jgi:hypothetical protein
VSTEPRTSLRRRGADDSHTISTAGAPDVDQSELTVQLWQILGSAPYLLVVLVGVALCIACASRAPKTALLVGLALLIQLLNRFVTPFIVTYLFNSLPADAADQLNMRIFMNSLVYSIPSSIALALLLWAAFQPQRQPREFDVVE